MPPFTPSDRISSIAEPRRAQALAVRVLAYVSGAWSLAIIAGHVIPGSPSAASVPQMFAAKARASDWTPASRPHPAFAVSQSDFAGKSESYEIFRHPAGGRKDLMRWADNAGDKPAMELEIYRPGTEPRAATDTVELATRLGLADAAETEAAGIVDTKFGPVSAIQIRGSLPDGRSCVGFMKNFESPRMRLSGYSCLPQQAAPAQRAAIGCLLNRLVLLSAGNDPKVAEVFAHAELKRASCGGAKSSGDWLTGTGNPRLRGRI